MADNKLLQQMLEHLVNDEQQKAEELFHEYVVAKSREIYEGLIEDELDESSKEEDDEEMDEAAKDDDAEDEKVDESSDEDDDEMDENFEEVAIEGDDEMPAMGGDPTDDLESDLEMGDEEGEKSEEELFQDLDAIVDELQAKFDELKGGDEMGGDEMGGDEMKDDINDLETVREYVEKVPAGHGAEKKGAAEKADNTKSTIDNMKNDMGGTTANILSSKEEAATYANQGQLKGNGLLKGTAKEDNAGNINVPGGKAGSAFSKKEPGHGAEKKGAGENADNKQSLFRGRR
jgi:hypothetical protein